MPKPIHITPVSDFILDTTMIETFMFREEKPIRVFRWDGSPWFSCRDIMKAVKYATCTPISRSFMKGSPDNVREIKTDMGHGGHYQIWANLDAVLDFCRSSYKAKDWELDKWLQQFKDGSDTQSLEDS